MHQLIKRIKSNEEYRLELADKYWKAWNQAAIKLGLRHELTIKYRDLYDKYSIIIINGVK